MSELRDLLEEILHPTPEQQEAERCAEKSFRRGYHHGFDAAIELIFQALDAGMTHKDAYGISVLMVNTIARWRADGTGEEQDIPPSFSAETLYEMLVSSRLSKHKQQGEP